MGYYSRLKKKYADTWGKSYASSYWYDTYDSGWDYLQKYDDKVDYTRYKKTQNYYKLASVRRAISNFVQIVTGGKRIPVTFATKSDSKTDGQRVVLSADVDDNFDVSVGLALHEASHIILSDFVLLKEMGKGKVTYDTYTHPIPSSIPPFNNGKYSKIKEDLFLPSGKLHSLPFMTRELFEKVYPMVMGLSNWIEDRRIDSYIYKTSPGYRDYYVSMYDHYFNDKLVTKALASDELTDETLESYFARIINLLNENTDLSKLKHLRSVVRMLDLKNISRITKSEESLQLAIDIVHYILSNIKVQQPISILTPGGVGSAGTGEDEGEGDDESTTGEKNTKMNGEAGDADSDEDDESVGEETDATPQMRKDRFSDKALKQLLKKIQKQTDFLNGDIKKKTVSEKELMKLDSIEESGTDLVRVGTSHASTDYSTPSRGIDCVVVKKLTDKVYGDDSFPCQGSNELYASEVERGIMLGTLLGKKLQIRSEDRETVFNRLRSGKIDKRQISSLGYENESVFFNHEVDRYKKCNLHISIDYSGSMHGGKIRKCVTTVMAIAKACQMARNINVQVSVRTTTGENAGKPLPWICLVYDSRKDSLKTLAKYMRKLTPSGTTPEGLTFEAIQKNLIPSNNDVDSFFLNFSDGQPFFNSNDGTDSISYSGHGAAKHTRTQVKRMEGMGIRVLSYFITENSDGDSEDMQIFRASYGESSKNINVENMMEVAKTMNQMFLKK